MEWNFNPGNVKILGDENISKKNSSDFFSHNMQYKVDAWSIYIKSINLKQIYSKLLFLCSPDSEALGNGIRWAGGHISHIPEFMKCPPAHYAIEDCTVQHLIIHQSVRK